MKWRFWLLLDLVILLVILGCSAKVMVPPEIDLTRYERIGLVDFSSNIKGNTSEFVTQKLLEEIRLSQEGLRIVKLGSEDKILRSIQEVKMDPETIREIGKKHKVNAIFVGDLSISSIRPEIKTYRIHRTEIFPPARSMRIKSEVELTMAAKLLGTENGSMVWADSAQGTAKVANVRMLKKQETHARKLPPDGVYFEAVDPEGAYGELVRHLIKEITADFKVSYKRVWKGMNLL